MPKQNPKKVQLEAKRKELREKIIKLAQSKHWRRASS